jgi:hypothetical protein
MKYIHISKRVAAGMTIGPGVTYNIGRNAAKRALRAGKTRSHWKVSAKPSF